jgi:putative Holliday junction resolvase
MHKSKEGIKGIILGIDYGTKKIGFAVGDTFSCTVEPKGVLSVSSEKQALEVIKNKIIEWGAVAIVIGLPLDKKGETQYMTDKVIKITECLKQAIALPIFFSDERYTTKVAQQLMQDSGVKKKPHQQSVDDWAAALILQCWLNK